MSEQTECVVSGHSAESDARVGPVIEGPFESNRVRESWWWERPNGRGDLGYNRPDVLLRCQRIWGGSIKVIRTVEHSTTTVHRATPPASTDTTGGVE